MKRYRAEKSPCMKRKTKPGPKKEENRGISSRQNAKTRLDVTTTLSLDGEAQVCIKIVNASRGVLLFHWLAAFQVDTFLCEGADMVITQAAQTLNTINT